MYGYRLFFVLFLSFLLELLNSGGEILTFQDFGIIGELIAAVATVLTLGYLAN